MGDAAGTIRQLYDAVTREEWARFFAFFDPEVEADLSRSGIPDLGRYRGRDELRVAA